MVGKYDVFYHTTDMPPIHVVSLETDEQVQQWMKAFKKEALDQGKVEPFRLFARDRDSGCKTRTDSYGY